MAVAYEDWLAQMPGMGDDSISRGLYDARVQADSDPALIAAQQRRNQEDTAYRSARTANLGGLYSPGGGGVMGANGVDYAKAVSDPSAAGAAFDASGYTAQQALADGWGTGVGSPGWQNTPASQHLNPNGGNVAAMYPGAADWGKQASPGAAVPMLPGQGTASFNPMDYAAKPGPEGAPPAAPDAPASTYSPSLQQGSAGGSMAAPQTSTPATPGNAFSPAASSPQSPMQNMYSGGSVSGAQGPKKTQSKFDPTQNAMQNMYGGG